MNSARVDAGFLADVIEQTIQGHTARCSCCPTLSDEARPLARAIARALIQSGYDLPTDVRGEAS